MTCLASLTGRSSARNVFGPQMIMGIEGLSVAKQRMHHGIGRELRLAFLPQRVPEARQRQTLEEDPPVRPGHFGSPG